MGFGGIRISLAAHQEGSLRVGDRAKTVKITWPSRLEQTFGHRWTLASNMTLKKVARNGGKRC